MECERLCPNVSSNVRLEDLFDTKRFSVRPRLHQIILYLPVAVLLLFTRLLIASCGYLILLCLPKTSLLQNTVLKIICKALGLVIELDHKYQDDNAQLLVANHVCILDRLAVNILKPCFTVSKNSTSISIDMFSFWKDVDFREKTFSSIDISVIQTHLQASPSPILHFPEGAITNGKVGLLKFHSGIFSMNSPIQPVLIFVSFPSAFSPSILNSSSWSDVLWCLVLPYTVYKIKTLPSMVALPDESSDDFCNRVQHTMSCAMNLQPTIFNSSDKAELQKRLRQEATNCKTASKKQSSKKSLPKNFGTSPHERMESYQLRRKAFFEAARKKYLDKHSISTSNLGVIK